MQSANDTGCDAIIRLAQVMVFYDLARVEVSSNTLAVCTTPYASLINHDSLILLDF